ncbi:hypothetical protein [Atopobacter phocae]|uniref:hypothetical protein n=1 Tax=Atopobacter phocae TaxID=136492 RepID=UPI000471F664|nr:hypothetical protein [Atopobacter phocae]
MKNQEQSNDFVEMKQSDKNHNLIERTESILEKTRQDIEKKQNMSIPIAELASFGSTIAEFVPQFRTMTNSTTKNSPKKLYEVVNQADEYFLQKGKDGNYWGSLRGPKGEKVFAKWREVSPNVTSTTVMPINPATFLMAAAIFSLDKKMDKMIEIEEKILSFLEIEQESEVEADVEMLKNIMSKYKTNWDNEHFVSNNHKLVIDIQRAALKNINRYQKNLNNNLKGNSWLSTQIKIHSKLTDLQKQFNYYRLSVYTYALASLLEILLSGNFDEQYIVELKKEINSHALNYRKIFSDCSIQLERLSKKAVEINVLKGIGSVSKTIGEVIGSIPMIKEGPVDELLQNSGKQMQENASVIEEKSIKKFASLNNPGTTIFLEEMDQIIKIYHHTSEIYFDDNKVYLIE